jgi:hypothetical protein
MRVALFLQENDIPTHCREILVKWKSVSQTIDVVTGNNAGSGEDMDAKLVRLLESQPRPTTVQRTYTEEERKIREAILAQYSQVFSVSHNIFIHSHNSKLLVLDIYWP